MRTIRIRTLFYLAVEGESEQSFIKWLQELCDKQGLFVHLDSQLIGGGGYKKMLDVALRESKRKERVKAKDFFLLVDSDRAEGGHDNWSLERLRREASKKNIVVCVQKPKLEGIFVRMLKEGIILECSANDVDHHLRRLWPNYSKPADARTLAGKFSLNGLLRVAEKDADLKVLLTKIGLKR